VVRGEADAERNRILAEAYGEDPEFFAFIRSLAAYEASLKGGNSAIVLRPDSEFFAYLRDDGGAAALPAGTEGDGAAGLPAAPDQAAPEPAAESAPASGAEPAAQAPAGSGGTAGEGVAPLP